MEKKIIVQDILHLERIQSELLFITGWFELVRAFSILGLLLLIVAVVMTVLKLFVMKDKKPVLFAGIGTSFAGGKNGLKFQSSEV